MRDSIFENARKHNKCPYCNNEVSTIILGEPFGSNYKELKNIIEKENLKVDFLGVISGDGSDPCYVCHNCRKEFDKNMQLMEFYECPRRNNGSILKEDCKKYILTNKKSKSFKKCINCIYFEQD